jgi:nitrate/nitrite transport system ATP-binding protein
VLDRSFRLRQKHIVEPDSGPCAADVRQDEPFGALDALTRASLQDELVCLVEAIRSTVVMVTHDIDEAIPLGDRILMMTNGPAARIGDVLAVALLRPRDRLALATSPQYAAYRQQLPKFLYQKQGVALE